MVRRAFLISSRMLICGFGCAALDGDSATWFLIPEGWRHVGLFGSLAPLGHGSLLLPLMLAGTWFLIAEEWSGSLPLLGDGSLLPFLMLAGTATWSSPPEQAPRTRFAGGGCSPRTDPGRFGFLAAAGFAIKAGFTRTREEQECRSAAAAALRRGSRDGGSTVVPAMVAAAKSREQRSNNDRESRDPAGGSKRMRWSQIKMDRGLGRRGANKKEETRETEKWPQVI